MGNNILKAFLALLFIGNLSWLSWNAYLFFGELSETEAYVEKAVDDVKAIERRRQLLKGDLDKIVNKGWVKVKDVNVALVRQLQRQGINPLDDGVVVPGEPKEGSIGRTYSEQVWKISFTNRDKLFSARSLAEFCVNVEKDMPGYQIKSVDLGQREKIWGKDLWRPVSIEVRRITLKEQK